jgi:hypothetical protein
LNLRVGRYASLALVLVAGCSRAPVELAQKLAAKDAVLAKRLAPAPGTWTREGDLLVSPGWRSAHLGPFYDVGARLPAHADGAITVGIGQSARYTVTLTPEGASAASVEEHDGHAVYRDAYRSTETVFVADKERVEWFFVLADSSAPTEHSWKVTLPPGLPQVKTERSGALVFVDEAGTPRLRVPRPYAVDAHGTRRAASLAWADGTLRVALDARNLVYPVLLDPAVEIPFWQEVTNAPDGRAQHAMAYDSARGVTVLFGGTMDIVPIGDTWEWNGTSWAQVATTGPGQRSGHAMAFDSTRNVTVLYGGVDGGGNNLSETWEWDGTSWTQRIPTTGGEPSGCTGHAMVYDQNKAVTLLFGGHDCFDASINNETWTWDGTQWTNVDWNGPNQRTGHAMSYDPSSGTTLLFGGYDPFGNTYDDTWQWNGSGWNQVGWGSMFGPAPSPRHGHAMAYDSTNGVTVLFGGINDSTGIFGDTWYWNNGAQQWTQQTFKPGGPGARSGHAMVYDSLAGVTVLYGGFDGGATYFGDTWTNWTNWTQRATPIAPTARSGHAMAYDSTNKVTLLFGGLGGYAPLADTWAWDGTSWTQVANTGPSARNLHAMAYDSTNKVTVLFGGNHSGTFLGDTWLWNQVTKTWTQVVTPGPSARYQHAMAYDSTNKVTVLFGGHASAGDQGDTWVWNGATWSKVATTGPSARYEHAMVYDGSNKVALLFGGIAGSSFQGDTWAWNGTSWTQVATTGPTRGGHAMAYDSASRKTILFGGENSLGNSWEDTWAWNGTSWTQVVTTGPYGRWLSAMAYDSTNGVTLLFGGRAGSVGVGGTWKFRTHGGPCATNSDCDTGFCIDGVCCEGASQTPANSGTCGVCQACNTAANPGFCTTIYDQQDPDSCTGTKACGESGTCVPQRANGAGCPADVLCTSGMCVDGVCCSSPCTGTCMSCAVAGFLGTCTPVKNADDNTCTGANTCDATGACKLKNGQLCSAGPSSCTSGICADGVCCNNACTGGGCDSCNRSGSIGTCTIAPVGDPGVNPSCSPYLCGGAAACPTTCTVDTNCASGFYCDSTGHCAAQKAQGGACNYAADCIGGVTCRECNTAGKCVDGFCCDTTCGAACDVCGGPNATKPNGTCGVAAEGYAGSPQCSVTTCNGTSTACPSTNTCNSDLDCQAGYYCWPGGTCIPQKTQGGICNTAAGADCKVNGCRVCGTPGGCVDGYCCNTTCANGCDACNLTGIQGTCANVASGSAGVPSCSPYLCGGGAACPTSCTSDAACATGSYCDATGHCVGQKTQGSACSAADCLVAGCHACGTGGGCIDGYCCDSSCGNGCDFCNLPGKLGQCTVAPVGSTGANPSCGPYLCDGNSSACQTKCTGDASCVAGEYCDATAHCSPKKAQGATCSAGDCLQAGCGVCASAGGCVDGYCCNTTCSNGCDYCNLPGVQGTCTNAAAGNAGANPSCSPYLCGGAAACPASCTSDASCAANFYCDATGHCTPQKGQASTCGAADCLVAGCRECGTVGGCVDGYCCDASCGAGCDFCNLPGKLGQCSVAPVGNPGANPSCAPYLCDGTSNACPTKCTGDSSCAAGQYCDSTAHCSTKKTQGATCSASDCLQAGCGECGSGGGCVDGYCCNTTCSGQCDICNGATPGVCTNAIAGAAGSPSCSPYLCTGSSASCGSSCATDIDCANGFYCNAAGQCVTQKAQGVACNSAAGADCKVGNCRDCGALFCVDGFCCNTGCSGACDTCSATPGTCTVALQGSAGSPSCGAYVCNGSSAACPTSCGVDNDCASGFWCNAGTCAAKKSNSVACSGAHECTSNVCAQGVCCGTTCNGQCQSCNAAGSVGTCVNVTGPGIPSCNGYLCSGSSPTCPSSCTTDTQCASGYFCAAGGTCQLIKTQGQACNLATDCAQSGNCRECSTGNCADGFCCNTACGGACDTCSATPGTCTVVPTGTAGAPSCGGYLCDGTNATCPSSCAGGAPCAAGFFCNGTACVAKKALGQTCGGNSECVSTFCASGVCCNAACTGNCQACDATGQCQNVVGPGTPSCMPYTCTGTSSGCPTGCSNDAACDANDYCSGGKCVAKATQGKTCGADDQCTTGHCSDGKCCDTACSGGCDVCAASLGANADGTCTIAGLGSPGGNPSCVPQICDGIHPFCPGGCASDADCDSAHYCNASGSCVPLLSNGSVCARTRQCTSGNCVGGYCCNTACAGGCDTCSATAGTCTVLSSGATGSGCGNYLCDGSGDTCPNTCSQDSDCATGSWCSSGSCVTPLAQGSACTRARQCSTSFCADGFCCNAPCTGGCDTCAATAGTCTVAAQGTVGANPSCGAYLCDGSHALCPSSCAQDSDCASGAYCSGTTCVPVVANGQACSTNRQCSSGNCVSGICCDQPCNGGCQTCSTGTCGVVAKGAPGSCGAYLCDGASSSCPTTCAVNGDCATGNFCAGTTCTPKEPNGASCTTGSQCSSNICTAEGVCCASACGGSCQTCKATPGTCTTQAAGAVGAPSCTPYLCNGTSSICPNTCNADGDCATGFFCVNHSCSSLLPAGAACSAAKDCATGNCVDGVCCDSACSGNCFSCNLTGSVGHCTQAPVLSDPRKLCPGTDPSCKSSCGANGLCVYPGMTTTCGSAQCVAGTSTLQNARSCDGQGACVDRGMTDCAPYYCSFAACPSSCVDDTLCVSPNTCSSSSCGLHRGPGQSCSANTDCDSGHCTDGVCCDTACNGKCQACNLAGSMGTCTTATGLDPHGDCKGEGLCAGTCAADRSCAFPDNTKACDTCKACNGNGKCNQMPASGDDTACAVIACSGLSTECVTFTDLTAMRCTAVGLCAAANDPTTCTKMTPVADGTACSVGQCMNGQCISSNDASTTPPGGHGTGGCSSAGTRPSPMPVMTWLLLLAIVFLRTRRKTP